MRKDFKSTKFSTRQITHRDWEAYRDFYKGLKDPAHFVGLMKGQDLDDLETYKKLFAATIDRPSYIMFGFWDQAKLVGQTSLFFEEQEGVKVAVFVGSERADAYKGKGLGDEFYRIRLSYLAENNFSGTIVTSIHPANTASLKAAKRHGFVETGTINEHDYIVLALVLQQGQSGGFEVETGFGEETDERMRILFIITESGNNTNADELIRIAMQEKEKLSSAVIKQLPSEFLNADGTIPDDFCEAIRASVQSGYLRLKGMAGPNFVPGIDFLRPQPR